MRVEGGLREDEILFFPRGLLLNDRSFEDLLMRLDRPPQRALVRFYRELATESKIKGVAVGRRESDGLSAHFFVEGEVTRENLDTDVLEAIGCAFRWLQVAASAPSSARHRLSYAYLGAQTLDERVEYIFSKKRDTGDPDNSFNPSPPVKAFNLVQIAKFE